MHTNYPGNILTPNGYIPSDYYRFWAKCLQTAGGTLLDSKNQNKTGSDVAGTVETGGTATSWDNEGWFTSENTAPNQTRVNYDASALTMTDTECIILGFRLSKANPGGQEQIMGNANSVNDNGFRFAMLTTGFLNLHIGDGAGNGVYTSDMTIGQAGSSVEHQITVILDNATRKINTFIDGVPSGNIDEDYPVGMGEILNNDNGFSVGSTSAGVLIAGSKDAQWRDIHALVVPSIPANMTQIARHLSAKPFHPLRDSDIELS